MAAIYEIFRDYVVNSGLFSDYKMQLLQWVDSGVSSDKFIVIIPDGGLAFRSGLGNQSSLDLTLVGSKNQHKIISDKAAEFLNYLGVNSRHSCIYHMYNSSGFPRPLFTDDNRVVIQLGINIISN